MHPAKQNTQGKVQTKEQIVGHQNEYATRFQGKVINGSHKIQTQKSSGKATQSKIHLHGPRR